MSFLRLGRQCMRSSAGAHPSACVLLKLNPPHSSAFVLPPICHSDDPRPCRISPVRLTPDPLQLPLARAHARPLHATSAAVFAFCGGGRGPVFLGERLQTYAALISRHHGHHPSQQTPAGPYAVVDTASPVTAP